MTGHISPGNPGLVVAAVQMRSGEDVDLNLREARERVREAAQAGASLIVLPENFAAMAARDDFRRDIAEIDGHGPIQDALADMASSAGVWVVGGTIPLKIDGGAPVAACCVYDDSGARQGRYDKIHLFDVDVPGGSERYRESANTSAGESTLTVTTPWGGLGLAVCYDLRFPELFRRLAVDGAAIVAVPAAFTYATGSAHWSVLLRARAIENLNYVVAAAQTGVHPGGRRTWGHSAIIGPWGEVVAECSEDPGIVLGAVDSRRASRLRAEFPVLVHRRLDLPED